MPTIQQIQDRWTKTEIDIFNRKFDLSAEAMKFAAQEVAKMSSDTLDVIGSEKGFALMVDKTAQKAEQLRQAAHDEYEAEYLLYADALQKRKAEVEADLFKPAGDAAPGLLLEIAGASPEKLGSLMDLALSTGNFTAGDVAFAEAHRRDDEVQISHYVAVRGAADEAWLALWEELCQAEGVVPFFDIGDRFDQIFGRPPDKSDLARELSVTNVKA